MFLSFSLLLLLICGFLCRASNWSHQQRYHHHYHEADKDDDQRIKFFYYTESAEIPGTTSEHSLSAAATTVTSIATIKVTSTLTFEEITTTTTVVPVTEQAPVLGNGRLIEALSDDLTGPDSTLDTRLYDALDQCSWDESDTVRLATRYFNAIVFGNYATQNSQEIFGPLAIGGNFSGGIYTVSSSHWYTCSDLEKSSALDSYGLVVRGITDTINTKVHGAAFLENDATMSQFNTVNYCCPVVFGNTGQFDFDKVQTAYLLANQELASFPPNIILDFSDTLTLLDDSASKTAGTENHYTMTLSTCTMIDGYCNIWPGSMSDANHMLLGNGIGMDYPVVKSFHQIEQWCSIGGSITRATNNPNTGGLSACRTIFNFYPVDDNGQYDASGTFTVNRNTGGVFQGLIIAPLGHLRDSGAGSFAGQLIGLDYSWQQGYGVAVKDFSSTGCASYFTGCIPLRQNSTETVATSSINSSTMESTTTSSSSSINIDTSDIYYSISSTENSDDAVSTTSEIASHTTTLTTTATQPIAAVTKTVNDSSFTISTTTTTTTLFIGSSTEEAPGLGDFLSPSSTTESLSIAESAPLELAVVTKEVTHTEIVYLVTTDDNEGISIAATTTTTAPAARTSTAIVTATQTVIIHEGDTVTVGPVGTTVERETVTATETTTQRETTTKHDKETVYVVLPAPEIHRFLLPVDNALPTLNEEDADENDHSPYMGNNIAGINNNDGFAFPPDRYGNYHGQHRHRHRYNPHHQRRRS